MNRDNENEHSMPSDKDMTAVPEDGEPREEEGARLEGAKPGTTDVQAYIGRQLRAVYDDVLKQPIPDRFVALMKQLEEGTQNR